MFGAAVCQANGPVLVGKHWYESIACQGIHILSFRSMAMGSCCWLRCYRFRHRVVDACCPEEEEEEPPRWLWVHHAAMTQQAPVSLADHDTLKAEV